MFSLKCFKASDQLIFFSFIFISWRLITLQYVVVFWEKVRVGCSERREYFFLMSKYAMINFLNMKILSAVIGICLKKKY